MAKMGTCSELDETKTSKKKNQQKNGPYFSPFPLNCVVPENIHTPPTEGHGNSKG